MKDIVSAIEKLRGKYIGVWENVCNIESPTSYKEGVDKVGKYFIGMAKDFGWKVEVLKQELAGDAVCITMNPDSELPPLSLSGHMDTVHPIGMFGEPAVKMDEKNIYGPGVLDCKGGIVAGMLAMEALCLCRYEKRPVQLLLQTDEECGSKLSNKATINWICEKAKGSVAFLNLECSHNDNGVTLSRKGIISYRFDITGIEAHSSRCAKEGSNAIIDAAHKMLELDKLKDADGITCNCALISGGTVLNTVPGKCSFSVNFRFKSANQLEWIKKYVKELSETVHVEGCVCVAEQIGERPAMEYSETNVKLLERINEIYKKNGLPQSGIKHALGGSDAAYVTSKNIPCVDSIGVKGGYAHSKDEYARLESLAESAKKIAAIAVDI